MIISAETVERIDDIVVREIDLVQVKGKNEPVAIFEPLGTTSQVSAERISMAQDFGEALMAYRQQDWDKAEEMLSDLKDLKAELLYNIYLDRIARFRIDAPTNDWTGVFQHLTK